MGCFFKTLRFYIPVKVLQGVLFLCVGALLFVFAEAENPYPPLKIFVESLHIIESNHPFPPPREDIIPGAVKGMLLKVDPYSDLMNKEQTENFYRANKSSYGGIGISLGFKDNKTVITSVFQNSPAFKKGLKAGDVITLINGKSLENESFNSTVQKMHGKIGQSLKLAVLRKEAKPLLHFSVPFSRIDLPSIQGRPIGGNFFYIKISSFRENTFQELKKILKTKRCENENYLCSRVQKGLVLDLRQNAGGLVDQALLTADLFIKEGILTSIKSRSGKKVFRAKKLGTLKPFPLVILIDEYSASSSEILASSLQDHYRAFLVGNTSFGKGSIQSLFKLDQGYSLKLTVSHYYTPKGKIIEQKGVEPDIKIASHFNQKVYEKVILDFKKKFYKKYDYPKKRTEKKESFSNSKILVQEGVEDIPLEWAVNALQTISL